LVIFQLAAILISQSLTSVGSIKNYKFGTSETKRMLKNGDFHLDQRLFSYHAKSCRGRCILKFKLQK